MLDKVMIMTVFVIVVMGRCCSGPVLRRTWLGLGGVGSVVAAGLAAYGLNSAFGELLAGPVHSGYLMDESVTWRKDLRLDIMVCLINILRHRFFGVPPFVPALLLCN